MDRGFSFKVAWQSTAIQEAVRAPTYQEAALKIRRRHKAALSYELVEVSEDYPLESLQKAWSRRGGSPPPRPRVF